MDTKLAVIETASNQRFIFDTNRLRDGVGASYLVANVGRVAQDHLSDLKGQEVLISSGKAEALFKNDEGAERARRWIAAVTGRFAEIAPGLDIAGVFVPCAEDKLDEARREAYRELSRARGQRPGPLLRHRTLPFLRPCDDSGEPALDEIPLTKPREKRLSDAVFKRREVFPKTRDRVQKLLEPQGWSDELIDKINDAFDLLSNETEAEPLSRDTWRGVVHADGNGLGRVFLHFGKVDQKLGVKTDEAYGSRLRAFSEAIELATWRALGTALNDLYDKLGTQGARFPVYPLIVGGDDLTLVMNGRWALFLARRYLEEFEKETAASDDIREVMGKASEVFDSGSADRIHACAGVAIVKHHFPFSVAYRLAEQLCTSAKRRVRADGPGSALDWHVVYDASPPELETIRQRMVASDETVLTRRPYLLKELESFERAAKHLTKTDSDGRRLLPNGPLHDLRQGLYLGAREAAQRLATMRRRVDRTKGGRATLDGLLAEVGSGSSLVDRKHRSGFVDVLDSQELMEGWSR